MPRANLDYIKTFIANNPGVTVVHLQTAFKTTRAAMGRRLTDLYQRGDVVKRPNGHAKPVSWFVAGKA